MLTARPNQAKASVLVVDDSPDMRRYLRLLLELDSFEVETACCGSEAVKLLREGYIPSIVLLDLEMPGIDGLKTLRRLRKLRPDIKVIMCSGVDDPRKVERAAALGAHTYLVKPVQHLYLSAALERCLNAAASSVPTIEPAKALLLTMPTPPAAKPERISQTTLEIPSDF